MRSGLSLLFVCTVVIVVASTRTVQGDGAGECPHKCMCFQNTVRCMFQKLSRVPRVPFNTTVLDLRFNNIAEIHPGAFRGLNNLHTLLLNDNQIKHLQRDAFNGIPNVRILYLYKNAIQNIEPGAFGNLRKLEQLYLHHNYLTEIKEGTFSNLPALERLFLHNNKLHRIPADAFRNVGPMTRLRLDSNALVCDCDIMWLVERLQDRPTEMAAICQSPSQMKGRSLTTMALEEFHCNQPRIMEGPKDLELKIGSTAVFTCRVSGNPKPEIKWMRNANEIGIDGDRYVISEDGSLVISDINLFDVGDYECIASSSMGITKSRIARAVITTSSILRFLESPISQNVKSGADVVFTCKVEGAPLPRIDWWRNGQLLKTGGRVLVEDNGQTLKIFSSKEIDSARYVCQARNSNGFAESSADLLVMSHNVSLPRLTYRPYDMEAEPGATVEIPCRADGDPKPYIQWKKDGHAVQSAHVRVSRAGSLYLYNVSIEDGGRYECSAVNEHGRATAGALVRIRSLGATDALIIRAFNDATNSVDRAINTTLKELFNSDGSRNVDPFRRIRYPDAVGRAAARPAELFEKTLSNIRSLVNNGVSTNATEDFHYEEILSPSQVAEIERLSGCTGHRQKNSCSNMCFHSRYRSIDGSCNNLQHPTWGSSYTGFRRILKPIYENGFSTPVGWEKGRLYYGFPKPPARLVSTSLLATHDITSDDRITHMVMQWGQFLDHDLSHSLPSVSSESWDGIDCKKSCDNAAPCFPMEVPAGDPRVNNRRCIDFIRTSAVCGSGETSILWGGLTPREQLNQLTSYLDASQVYGYDDALSRDLRDLTSEQGLLREGPAIPGHKPFLPYASGQFVDCRRNVLESSVNCFVAGDIRANEQVGLLAMHTIWLREHNRVARELFKLNPHWDGERLFQEARRIVGAEMQHITFNDWIPQVLGATVDELLGQYRGYNPNVDVSISNVFATAALRFGHALIQPQLERLNERLQPIPQGALSLRDAFFSPWRLVDEGGVDPLMRGMFATPAKLKLPEQNLNFELTEQLFRTAHAVALDLAAMNIQRSRDHAIPGYLEWRQYCNMSNVETFDDLAREIRDPRVRDKLRELYGHPGNIDVWVGGILEDQLPNAKVGPLFQCLLLEQFRRLREGDRFWHENPSSFRPEQLTQIKQVSLARILCDNGDNITRIQRNVFLLPDEHNGFSSCDEIPQMDLRMWSDCCEDCEDDDNTISRVRRSAVKYSAGVNEKTSPEIERLSYERQIKFMEKELFKMRQKLDKLAFEISLLQRNSTSNQF